MAGAAPTTVDGASARAGHGRLPPGLRRLHVGAELHGAITGRDGLRATKGFGASIRENGKYAGRVVADVWVDGQTLAHFWKISDF